MRDFDSNTILRIARRPTVKWAIAVGLAFYFVYHLMRFDPARIRLLLPPSDTAMIFDQARKVFAHDHYSARLQTAYSEVVWPYPPSAVVLFRSIGILGPRASVAAWMALIVTALLVAFRSSLAGERDDIRAAWLALGAVSLGFTDWPVSWDLRAGNCNVIYLGLVLAGYGLMGRRPWLGGVLVGSSISLKLYSGLLLMWLLINDARRALYGAVIAIVVLWLLLPAALFGPNGTIKLYAGWYEQIRIISRLSADPAVNTRIHGLVLLPASVHRPPTAEFGSSVTLQRAVIVLTGGSPRAPLARSLRLALWASWLIALGWYARRAQIGGRVAAPSRAALADWTVLMLAPLPFSPWLEPYHTVPILPGAILCLANSLDECQTNRGRIISVSALLALPAVAPVALPWRIRGLGLLAQFLILVATFGLLRPGWGQRRASPSPERSTV